MDSFPRHLANTALGLPEPRPALISSNLAVPVVGLPKVLPDPDGKEADMSKPVLILKSCIGNRSLGWNLLPPGGERYEVEEKDKKTGETKTFIYAGYKDSPAKWEKGSEPKKIGWAMVRLTGTSGGSTK